MKTSALIAAAAAAVNLAACGTLSGLDANSSFACKAPSGVLCESMTGIYANAEQKNLPGQRVNASKADSISTTELSQAKEDGVLTKPIYSGTPIRSAPRVLRVWFAPWEDTDGDLHDQSYVYLPVDAGRWLIEHNRRRIQDAYRPVHAPAKAPAASAVPAVAASNVQAGSAQGMESIGIAQDRPSEQDAASMMGGIQLPGQFGQPTPAGQAQ